MARKIHDIEIEVSGGDKYAFRYRKASAAYMLRQSDLDKDKRKNETSAVALFLDCLVDEGDKPFSEKQIKEMLADMDSEVLQQLSVACIPSSTAQDDAKNA